MKYYVWLVGEGEEGGEQILTENPADPEPSADGEGDGSTEFPAEAAPGYTETETDTEETEEQTEGEEEEEVETDQYGLVEIDYTESFQTISDQLEQIQIIGYATTFILCSAVLFTLILRILRN